MNWTPQQEKALQDVGAWIRNPGRKPFYYLAGYAGTGKTTLAKHLAQDVVGEVLFGAFTGKAAHVLRTKGCPNASTIHSMIYIPRAKCRERLTQLETLAADHLSGKAVLPADEYEMLQGAIAEERKRVAQPSFALNEDSPIKGAGLVVLDECSMLNDQIGNDILSFGVPVLVLGDPAQLPPVRGGGFFTASKPDTLLTDIQRQARDNPIIDMATRVRQGDSLPYGDYGSSKVVERADRYEALTCGQILVGRNATRLRYNSHLRSLMGRTRIVEEGDKIVCLRNNHDLGLLNGSIWWVDAVVDDGSGVLNLSIFNEEARLDVPAHEDVLAGQEPVGGYFDRQGAEEFTHAGALTVHKAQGSQWDDVMVVDESSVFRSSAREWLYTALTRAAERVTVVR